MTDFNKPTDSVPSDQSAAPFSQDNLENYFVESERLAGGMQFEEAVAVLRNATENFPTSAEAHYNLGVALFLKLREDNAHLELWEDNSDANADTEEAIQSLQSAIELKPDMVPAYNNLARLYAVRGDAEDALAAWRKSLELDEHQPIIREELELYKNKIGPSPDSIEIRKELKDGEEDAQL